MTAGRDQEEKIKGKSLGWILLAALFLSGALSLCIGAACLFIQTERGAQWISRKISVLLPGKIEVSHLSVNLLKGKIGLSDVRIDSPAGDRVLSLSSLTLEVALSQLFSRGILVIERLEIDSPDVRLVTDEKGRVTLVEAFLRQDTQALPEEPPIEKNDSPFMLPVNVVLNHFSIGHGRFRYILPGKKMDIEIAAINLTGTGTLYDKSVTVSGVIGPGFFQMVPYYQTALSGGRFHATLTGETLQVDCLAIDGEMAGLSAAGRIETLFSHPLLDVALDVFGFDLAGLFSNLYLKTDLSGIIDGRINVEGSIGNPEVTLSLVHERGNLFVCDMDRLILDASMKDRKVHISRLSAIENRGGAEITGEVDLSRMFPKGFISRTVVLDSLAATLHLKATAFDLKSIPLIDPQQLQGIADGDIDLSLLGVNPKKFLMQGKSSLAVSNLRLSGYSHPVPLTLGFNGNLKKGVLSVDPFELKQQGVSVNASGNIDFLKEAISMDMAVKADPESVPSPNPLQDLKGIFSSQIKISGSLKKPEIFLIVAATDFSVASIGIGDLFAQASLSPQGRVDVERITIKRDHALIEGKGGGDLFLDRYRLNEKGTICFDLSLENAAIESFFPNRGISGRVDGEVTFTGNLHAPLAKAGIRVSDAGYGAYKAESLEMGIGLKGKSVVIDRIALKKGGSQIVARGEIRPFGEKGFQVKKNPGFHLEIEKGQVFLGDFFPSYQGEFTLQAALDGSLKEPEGAIRISGRNIDLKHQRVDEALIDLEIRNRIVTLKECRVSPRLGQAISGEGWISLEKDHPYEFGMRAEKFLLTQIDPLYKNAISGYLDLLISGKGVIASPQITGTLRVTGLMQEDHRLEDIFLDLAMNGERLSLNGGVSDFSIKGGMDLKTRSYRLDARFDNMEMAPYIRLSGRKEDLRLNLDGTMSSIGDLDDLGAVNLTVDLKGVDFRFEDLFFLSTTSLKGSFKKGEFQIDPCRLSLPENGFLDIDGQLRLDGPLNFSMVGRVPLRMATPFTQEFSDISGNLTVAAHLGGTIDTPDLNGRIAIEESGFVAVGLEQRIEDVNGLIQVSTGRIDIDHIEGRIDNGQFGMKGTIQLDGIRPLSLDTDFSAQSLPITLPDTMSVVVNSNLKVTGTPERASATGEITLVEGIYYKNHSLNLVQGISKRDRRTKPASSKIGLPFLKNLDLDIAVKPQRPFVVDNNLAQLDVISDLRIGGKLNTPVVKGRTAIREGEVYYFKKTFVVEKGIIDFLNPYRTDPILAIKANTTFREWIIYLDISGPPDDLICTLSSSPPANHEDILSLLVMGKTISEIEKSSQATSAPPEQMVAELLVSTFDHSLKEKTGLDIIELNGGDTATPNNGSNGASDQLGIMVGKELSPRLLLKYSVQNTDQGINQKTMAEYKFLEHILLNGFQDSNGNYGGELQLKLEFR